MELEEETLQNLRSNIVKDHRRRLLFVDKKKQEGYQVQPSDMKKVGLYSARKLYSLMVFLVLFGILKQRFILAIIAAALVLGGLEVYFRYFFLKDRNIVKIRDQEFAIFSSLAAHEDNKSDAFIRVFLPLLLMVVTFSVLFDPQVNNNPIDINLMKVAILVLPIYSGQNLFLYFKERKIIKEMKNSQK